MVTDTAMVRKDGVVYAFGPVVRELGVFLELFDKIQWVGYSRPDMVDDLIMIPVPSQVDCVLFCATGGNSIIKKLTVILYFPFMFWHIMKRVSQHEVIHARAPSSPAFIAVLLSPFFRSKIWWHKYAGNWVEESPPFFYSLQRELLKKVMRSKVTINGNWLNQPKHCLSFENPCLDNQERKRGALVIKNKNYDSKLELCFVGALTDAKGVNRLLEAIPQLHRERIACIHFVGDGPLRGACDELAKTTQFHVKVHGFLSRKSVSSILETSHLLVLPSRSEGFPKVIAEGANYGCVPIVSNISALNQYILPNQNGFLLSPERLEQNKLAEDLNNILLSAKLKKLAIAAYDMAEAFTFNHYYSRIRQDILIDCK